MNLEQISQLSDVAQALYLDEYKEIQSVLAAESDLRSKLAKLDALIERNRRVLHQSDAVQHVGADLLWQGWTMRTRRQLNLELAQVMARKTAAMDGVRTAFGRLNAVDRIAQLERSEIRNQQRKISKTHIDGTGLLNF